MQIARKMKEKREKLTNEHGPFRNEAGAIDLASVMVGIVVIGLIGGAIAATVFGVIPWAQDNGAKAQLDSVVAAQSAYMGLSSAVPPAVPTGHAANSYASSEQLDEAGLLKKGPKHCAISTETGKGYVVFTKSDSGKVWTASNKNTKPEIYTGNLPTECAYIAASASSSDDTDGDGIPNESDRDADGDGVPDGYVAGGPIATLDGTSQPTSGTYYSTLLTSGGTTIASNATNSTAPSTRKISMHFLVTCVKDDGSFYKRNFLNGYTATAASNNTTFNTVPCAAGERVDEYTIKPVTLEAMASGEISNPEYFGGWTFVFNGSPGGVRWSEPDGYPKSGNFQSAYLAGGGSTVYATFQNATGTATTLGFQYILTCEKPDKTTYTENRLGSYTSRTGYIENTTFGLTACGTDRVTAYEIFPVSKLGDASNRSIFMGYSLAGSKSWKEERDGYPTNGNFVSAYLGNGGTTVYATFKNATGTATVLATQYILTCERPDGTTYEVNRISAYTSRSGYIENTTFGFTGCGTDLIVAYDIFPVNDLGAAESRAAFGGYTFTGSKSWTEADGYLINGNFVSAYVGNGGSTVYATFKNGTGTPTVIATQYILTCERPDDSTYKINRISAYTSPASTIDNATFGLTCGTDRVTAYDIFPVNDLGAAENRAAFMGHTFAGISSWTEADGYRQSGNFVSAYVGNGGSTAYATFQNETGTATVLATQYTMNCEKADKTTYSINRLAAYTSRAGYIENSTLSLTGCGTDRITSYEIFPVNKLGDVDNRTVFGGTSLKGSYSWNEERDGYRKSGTFITSYIGGGGTTVYATFQNSNGTPTSLATQYILTCKRADNSTYKVNRLAAYTSRAGYIENSTLSLTGCGTDQVSAYEIFPVSRLGDVENRTAFVSYALNGSHTWTAG